MKYILRFFGLVSVKNLTQHLDEEAKYWDDKKKNLTDPQEILYENYNNLFSHYAECLRDFKSNVYLLNKWW